MSSSSLLPAFQRAKQAISIARVDRSREDPVEKMTDDAKNATDSREKLQLTQRALEFYPYCFRSRSVLGNYYLFQDRNLPASIEAFQTGMEADRRANPSLVLERTDPMVLDSRDWTTAQELRDWDCAATASKIGRIFESLVDMDWLKLTLLLDD